MAFIKDSHSYTNNDSSLKFLSSESLQNIYCFNSSPNVAAMGKYYSILEMKTMKLKRKTGQIELKEGKRSRLSACPLPPLWAVVLHVF